MIQAIVLGAEMIIALIFINSLVEKTCGFDSSGEHKKVIEGTMIISLLYLIIIALFGENLKAEGIPFVDKIDNYSGFTDMYRENLLDFGVECAELISLTFVISLISNLVPTSIGDSGFAGKIVKSIILVLIGIIVNNYFLIIMKQTVFFSWTVTALQCFFSGTALIITPAMMIGSLLNMKPESKLVSFLIEKLPKTKIGQAISTATSNSLIFIVTLILFEKQFGSITSLMSQTPALIALFAPTIITIIGIKIMVKAAFN